MAHYKRGYARTSTRGRKRNYLKWVNGKDDWGNINLMGQWPRWWDIEFHTRPKRRAEREMIVRVLRGDDPDNLSWPLGNHKPHRYYW